MKKTAHVIPHSHWDREWRYPIWENRGLLVVFMDELLELLENRPNYKQFIMDGQSVILDDYLEIRPEKRELVEKYVKEGRIAAGPWYTLPDLYPLDGECLVRNLLKGFRVSAGYGKTMKVAYTSFGWGQTAQFPQIYLGFGIDFCITAKRVTEKRAPKCEFWWEAPDGTKILTTRLGDGTRHKFFETTMIPARYGRSTAFDVEFEWKNSGYIYHKANAGEDRSEYFRFDNKDGFYPETLKKNIEDCWNADADSLSESDKIMLCGSDFTGAEAILDKVIEEGNKTVEFELKHSTIEEYIKRLKETIDENELVTVEGELREGPSAACSGNALSTRIYIKQLNKKIQNLLIHRSEPINTVMMMFGEEYETGFFNKAWEFLLKSHAHDSINGVTQDSTAEDVMARLHQAKSLADVTNNRGMMKLIRRADLSQFGKDDVLLMVYNPLAFARREIVKVCVDVPQAMNAFDLKITDDAGNEAKWQKIDVENVVIPVEDINSRPEPFFADRHTIYLDTGEIPAGGFRVYRVETDRPLARRFMCSTQYQRVSSGKEISLADNTMENEFLKVTVNTNGTVNILDKEAGITYKNMHCFEETGEVGDYWINIRPNQNRKYTSIAQNADIWMENNGDLSATIGIRTQMDLPEESIRPGNFFAAGSRRSDREKTMVIKSYFTLKKNSKKLDVRVEINNNICDHRVRVVYPTAIRPDYSYAHGHFTVDRRPVAKAADGEYEPDMQTLPMQTFVDVNDGKSGVAFINNSLTEFEAKENGDVCLTMFRGVRNNICTECRTTSYYPEQTGGQCLGMRVCEYSIYPHSGNWYEADVMQESQRFNIVPTVMQTAGGTCGDIEPNIPLAGVSGRNIVMSSLKKAEDRNSIIMRIYNPTDADETTKITLAKIPQKAYFTNMNEEREAEFDVNEPLKIGRYKILTLEFEF